jgi:hypothetical protein
MIIEGGRWSTRIATRYAATRNGKVVYPRHEFWPGRVGQGCRGAHLARHSGAGSRARVMSWLGPGNLYPPRIPVDGTVIWNSQTGQKYLTRPGSRLLFPALCLPTGEIPTAPTPYRPPGDRGVMMPLRRRTREQDRAHRIDAEHVPERNQPPPI